MPGDRLEGFPELWRLATLHRATRGAPKVDGARLLGNVAALRYSTLERSATAGGVAVTAGTTGIVLRVRFATSVAGTAMHLGYGDNDVGMSSAAAPANLILLTPDRLVFGSPYIVEVVNRLHEWEVYYEVAAGKFLCLIGEIGVQTSFIETLGVEV